MAGEGSNEYIVSFGKRVKLTDEEDRISNIGDDIFIKILSYLTMKQAATLSSVSKRLNAVWSYHPRLNFDASRRVYDYGEPLSVRKAKFTRWVNRAVMSHCHQGSTLEEFRVRFDLDKLHASDITSWVTFAFENRVKVFELNLYINSRERKSWDDYYPFPLALPNCRSLTSLQLVAVHVSDEIIHYLLANCPSLENVSVHCSNLLVNLKVAGASLKYLDLQLCVHVKSIEISATQLVSFKYHGPRISLQFKNVPRLVELGIGGDYCSPSLYFALYELSSYLSQIESLTLHYTNELNQIDSHHIPNFERLKHLKLKVVMGLSKGLMRFTRLIEACPLLSSFKFEMWFWTDGSHLILRRVPRFEHKHLKFIEFDGFVGKRNDVELVAYLIESSSMLEKVFLDTRDPGDIGKPWQDKDSPKRRSARKTANELGKKLLKGVHLVIV